MSLKLAEALLRRKELEEKVKVLRNIKENQLVYEVRAQRIKVSDGFDDLNANFPKLDVKEVTAEFDFHARQLRLIDAAIQQANWTTEIVVDPMVMADFEHKKGDK